MDPVGPWSAYASYNRLTAAGVQPGPGTAAELHHHLTTTAATGVPPTTTAQLLTGGFLSPPPVGYENVFPPLFHHAGAKQAHYVSQHRAQALAQAAKQQSDGEFHQQAQAFFEQGAGAWQQNSPFGILPHESVVATTNSKSATYENFNAHFAAAQSLNHMNTQLANAKNAGVSRAQSPQVTTATVKSNSTSFFQVPVTFTGTENSTTNSKTANNSNLQQSCIVSSPASITPVTKEYRVPQTPSRAFLSSPNSSRAIATPSKQTSPGQIQTKAQTKIYPEITNQSERPRNNDDAQSSPISFSIMDAPGRLNYSGSNSSGKRPPQFQHSTYRHYQQATPTPEDFQRSNKSGAEFNSNGPDCNVVIPRRPSPLQAHSQASPLGHAPSPVYPMYNSPMNSISSPQQNTVSVVAPPSPLDVSVSRPSSQSGNVAYPSVITRALNSEKSFPERFERANQQQSQTSQQNCWDDRQQPQRKFQSNSQANNYNSNSSIDINPRHLGEQGQQRTAASLSVTERQQQAYFETNSGHQIPLQDLSSCRGDPMSIVKNLQQQQSCQVQQTEIKQEIKPPIKRRKSGEKPVAPVVAVEPPLHVSSRIPPPAHSSGANQQPQNGAYFDFDRWNLPPPTSKIFSTQAIHQQHQGLMVPHPHGHHAPPIQYFAPFHLAAHPTEFAAAASVELPPISNYEQPGAVQFSQQPEEEQPKVVVPNIEEELNFLSEDNTKRTTNHITSKNPIVKPPDKPAGPGAGFMSSYLKFLQGERDSSPPPAVRGGRKQPWPRTKCQTLDGIKPAESNGVPLPTQPTPPPAPVVPAPITRLSQGDPQDDPRYFPLPKERKRNSFDSSDDYSSDDDFFGKKTPATAVKPEGGSSSKEKPGRKGRPCKPGGPTERRKMKQQEKLLKKQEKQQVKEKQKEAKHESKLKPENIPRRESAKRAAKEKNNLHNIIKQGVDDEAEEPPEFQDSDSDPAWTPAAKNEDEEIVMPIKKNKRGRAGAKSKKGLKNLIAAAAQGAGIQDIDGYTSDGLTTHGKRRTLKNKQNAPLTLEDNIAASLQNNIIQPANEDNPFKTGEFVAIKSELNQEWPAIWRVDGKTLLQKYEPFDQSGTTLYRNISTYTSWTPESKKQYVSVPVKYKTQGQLETIVELLKNEMTIIDHEHQELCMKQAESYQDNFEVYIQTLISQALDSNFLMEIFHEKDEYFLSNVRTIDEITETKKQKLLSLLRWPPSVQAAVCTWPCFNVIREVNAQDAQSRTCAACGILGVAVRVLMYGQPYNSTTLEGCQPDPNAMNEKDFLMCRICANRVELSNKVTHQKYLMYIECAKRVGEKRGADPNKDTTCILNELLADEHWLNQLFLEVRTLWSEIDCIEHSFKMKSHSAYAQ